MRVCLLTLVLVLLGCAVFGCAHKSPPAAATAATAAAGPAMTAPADLQAWAAKLGADDFHVRDEAEDRIVAMGDAAEQPMRELAATATDAEVQTRAADVIRRLQEARVRAQTLRNVKTTDASLVTLHANHAPAEDVYRSLFEQAGVELDQFAESAFRSEKFPPITFDVDRQPFWVVFEQLGEITDITAGEFGNRMTVEKANGMMQPRDVSISGPYMVIAEGPRGHYERLHVFFEPKLRVAQCAREAQILEAEDALGKPVHLPQPGRVSLHEAWPRGGNVFEVSAPQPETGRIGHLKGFIEAVVLGRDESVTIDLPKVDRLQPLVWEDTVTVDNLANVKTLEKTVGGRRFRVNFARYRLDQYLVNVKAFNTVPPTSGLGQTRATLVDAGGNQLQPQGHSGSGTGGAAEVTHEFQFKKTPSFGWPVKLVLEYPAEATPVKIPFEFGKPPAAAGVAAAPADGRLEK